MAKGIVRVLLGLSIIASGVAIASPASAQTHQYSSYAGTYDDWCLSVQGANSTPGTRLITWPCNHENNDNAQKWALQSNSPYPGQQLASSIYYSGQQMCAALQAGATIPGTQVITWMCNNRTADKGWNRIPAGTSDAWGHPCYYFQSASNNDRYLTVQGGTPGYATNVVIWTWTGDGAQIWCQWQ